MKEKKERVYRVMQADGKAVEYKLDRKATLAELQAWVGGYIEPVQLTSKQHGFVDEEGLLKGLSPNPMYPQLVGNVVLLPEGCRT